MRTRLISYKLTLLQYNVNKSRDKVMIGLLQERRIKDINILAIQEPWRNSINEEGYNPRNSPFNLIEKTLKDTKVAIYINKDILISDWDEIYKGGNLISIRLRAGTSYIYIHNIYIEPTSHASQQLPSALEKLKETLLEY